MHFQPPAWRKQWGGFCKWRHLQVSENELANLWSLEGKFGFVMKLEFLAKAKNCGHIGKTNMHILNYPLWDNADLRKKESHTTGINQQSVFHLKAMPRNTSTNLLHSNNLPVSKVACNLIATKCYKYLRTSLIIIINTFSEQIKTDFRGSVQVSFLLLNVQCKKKCPWDDVEWIVLETSLSVLDQRSQLYYGISSGSQARIQVLD